MRSTSNFTRNAIGKWKNSIASLYSDHVFGVNHIIYYLSLAHARCKDPSSSHDHHFTKIFGILYFHLNVTTRCHPPTISPALEQEVCEYRGSPADSTTRKRHPELTGPGHLFPMRKRPRRRSSSLLEENLTSRHTKRSSRESNRRLMPFRSSWYVACLNLGHSPCSPEAPSPERSPGQDKPRNTIRCW